MGAQATGDLGGSLGYLFRIDAAYRSEANVGGINDNNPQTLEPGYSVLSGRFMVQFGADRQYAVGVFGENLTDEGACQGRPYQPFGTQLGLLDPVSGGTVVRCNTIPPRTVGVSLRASF